MIKRIIATLFAVLAVLPAVGEKTTIPIKGYKGHADKVDQPVKHRNPMLLPVEVTYDDEAMTIEVSCTADLEGEVSVYDSHDEMEGYSPCMNSIIPLTSYGYHIIVIEGDDWIGTGVIE
ncbi:MAG: hypothetical protein HDS03_07895 [Bacteroides sp.]|nr:hypothetical protein [Bacteroides sp.]